MNRRVFITALRKLTFYIEMLLTIILAVGVIISLRDLIWYFPSIWNNPPGPSYVLVKDFLGHVLLLVVGVELMLMLINHSMVAILQLIMFVIARKMLIYAETMVDLLLGTLSVAVIFLIFHYLLPNLTFTGTRDEFQYKAETGVEKVRFDTGIPIDSEKGQTIKEVLTKIATENNICIVEGSVFNFGELQAVVEKMDGTEIANVKIIRRHIT
ncbi:MAG: hypothetical protein Q4G61_06540 [Tissierellia bacterium]|nr:hypothetical protein [Tissierellia bacterium]